MQLLVEPKVEIACYITVLLIQSISGCSDLVCQLAKTRVVVWLDDIVVPFKLGEIKRLLDHLGILIETSSVLFEVAEISFVD